MNMSGTESRLREVATSSLKVGVSTAAGLLGWIVGGKILALELGAAGVGVFGLLRQLLQNLTAISTFAGATALVQGVASRTGARQARFAWTVGHLLALGGAAVALVLLAFAPWLGPWLVPYPGGAALLRWLALAVLAVNAQTYFIGLLNAHRAVNALIASQVMGPVAVLALAYPAARLVQRGYASGLVVMLAAPAAAIALAGMVQVLRAGWLEHRPTERISREDASAFFRTSFVLLTSSVLVTGTQYLQNRLVAQHLGLEQAGQFWVAWTLSMTYVTILLGSYGTYYMPALSALTEPPARHALIRDYLRLALLVMPLLVTGVIVVKPWVVRGMFSAKLLPALGVMRWMLVADYLKGVAWVLSFPMLAFNEMRWFFWTEALFNIGLAIVSWAWLARGGQIEGLGIVVLALHACYLPLMWAYLHGRHGFRVRPSELGAFALGLGLVVLASRLTWDAPVVEARTALTCAGLGAAFALAIVKGFGWGRRVRA